MEPLLRPGLALELEVVVVAVDDAALRAVSAGCSVLVLMVAEVGQDYLLQQ